MPGAGCNPPSDIAFFRSDVLVAAEPCCNSSIRIVENMASKHEKARFIKGFCTRRQIAYAHNANRPERREQGLRFAYAMNVSFDSSTVGVRLT